MSLSELGDGDGDGDGDGVEEEDRLDSVTDKDDRLEELLRSACCRECARGRTPRLPDSGGRGTVDGDGGTRLSVLE